MKTYPFLSFGLFVIGLVVVAGCSKGSASNSDDKTGDDASSISQPSGDASSISQPSSDAPSITQASREAFQKQCSTCHGEKGDGNGPMAMALKPPARNWTDRAWQESTSDDEIRDAIVKGGRGVGKSGMMPAYDLPAEVVDELVRLIRSFAHE
jgi:mono/diheme cytochrome c family protein